MVVHARLGGEQGIRLNRAAFAVIIKFSGQADTFNQLLKEIEKAADKVPKGSKDANTQIMQMLSESNSASYRACVSKWEQGSQMRKWT